MTGWRIEVGDALERLQAMPDESVQACVTSPPYFGLRDYGADGQIGLEATLDDFLARLLAVFAEVHRVLRSDGTLWVNIGDSYASKPRGSDNGWDKSRLTNPARVQKAQSASLRRSRHSASAAGAKQKDLMGVPWLLAFALREQGWWLREDIIWHKPTPMPEPVTDRCTRAHEYIFRLTKSARYYADQDAIREPLAAKTLTTFGTSRTPLGGGGLVKADNYARAVPDRKPRVDADGEAVGANKRSVWTVRGTPFTGFDRRVRVPQGAEGDGIERIASPSCPVHGGQAGPASTALRDERASVPLRRSPHTSADPAQGLLLDCAPIDPLPAPDSSAESSDSPDPSPLGPASGRSTQSRRTDPAPATTPTCTSSVGSPAHTPGTSGQLASSERHPDTPDRSSGGAGSVDPRGSGTIDRTAHRPSLSGGSACTCEFYRVEQTDHFATFPPQLVEPMILASTAPSACGACGAPWRRRREAAAVADRPGRVQGRAGDADAHGPDRRNGARRASVVRTTGWESTCNHDDVSGRCVVLDPFAGAGTTGLVALRHGRSFVGIEINADYADLARRRIIDDAPLLNAYAEAMAPALDGLGGKR